MPNEHGVTSLDRIAVRGLGRKPSGVALEAPFHYLTAAAALVVVLSLVGLLIVLGTDAAPAIRTFGAKFLISSAWNPVDDNFGALPATIGTLITAAIAMAIGAPIAMGVAIFINEVCPHRLRGPLSVAIELLAAVPSIIYGMWGLFVLAPFLGTTIYPALITYLGPIPIFGQLFQGPPFGIGVLTAGAILGFMVLPFIASVSIRVLSGVPAVLREAAYGVGATRWEVARYVLIPQCRRGLTGGVMLGLGRALGETMAVTFVIGNAHKISPSLLHPGTTISATLANEFTEANGDLYLSSLVALGLILFVITFAVLVFARVMLAQADRKAPV
jgi:phosphate transport system permease protein